MKKNKYRWRTFTEELPPKNKFLIFNFHFTPEGGREEWVYFTGKLLSCRYIQGYKGKHFVFDFIQFLDGNYRSEHDAVEGYARYEKTYEVSEEWSKDLSWREFPKPYSKPKKESSK